MRLRAAPALIAVTAALAMPGPAEAATRNHHRARGKAELAEALAAIRAQQGQIDQLRLLVAQQADAIAHLQSRAPVAEAAPDAPAPPAPTVAAIAPPAVAAPPSVPAASTPPPVQLAASTQFRALAYFNESTIHQTANGAPVPSEGVGFNIKRLYLGVDHQFNPMISASVLTDIRNVVGSSSNGNNAGNAPNLTVPVGRALYLKNAYLQARFDPAFIVRLGAAGLPWISFVESQYGYRHIENTLVDRVKAGYTADWGVHVLGSVAHDVLSYQISATDGSGYSDLNVTRYVDLEGRLSAQYRGLFAAIGGYDGHLGNSISSTTGQFAAVYHAARREDFAAGYKSDLLTLGGEFFYARDYKSVNTPTEDSSRGWSAFGNVNLAPKWSVFGRYDQVRNIANLTAPKPVNDHYVNAGVQWEPLKPIDLALVYKREAVNNGTIATQTGTIGASTGGTYDEFGLFGQFRF